ncbi:MAG: hypothetical protein RL748_676 [Pseudomonadota bacterium]
MKLWVNLALLGCFCWPLNLAYAIQVVGDSHILSRPGHNHEVSGPGADLVREVMHRANLPFTFNILPWARAYAIAEGPDEVMIINLGRTAERENKFKWVGEIIPVEYRMVKLKSRRDIQIKTLDDARNFQIGVQNQDICHRYLINKGFPSSALQTSAGYEQAFAKLLVDRVDLVPRSHIGIRDFCEKSPQDCDKIEVAYRLDEVNTSLFMAFSKHTPDEVVARARKAYEQIRADGTWQKIMAPLLK